MSVNRGTDKEDMHIMNRIMPFAAIQMQLEMIVLREVNQKERQMPYGITYMWNLKYDTNELLYKTNAQTQNGLVVATVGVRDEWKGSVGLTNVN